MKAAVFKGVGLPLSIETRTDPVPGEGEIVLRVGYCRVCGGVALAQLVPGARVLVIGAGPIGLGWGQT
jgi:threonine dehydrogenase-like Zn-dependent dehydrogenase